MPRSGFGLVRGLIEQGLIDRLRLLMFPVVLGRQGARKVFEGYGQTDRKLVDTMVLDSSARARLRAVANGR